MSVFNLFSFGKSQPEVPKAPLTKKELASSLLERMTNLKSLSKKAQVSFVDDLFTLSKLVEREEIADWQDGRRQALRSNRSCPQTYKLMEVHRRTLLDLHIQAAIRNRRSRFLNKKLVVKESDGTINEDKTELLNRQWMRKYLRFEFETLFFGYGVAWFGTEGNRDGFEFTDFNIISRTHVNPYLQMILKRPYDLSGLSLTDASTKDWNIFSCLEDEGTESHLGLLNSLAPMKILKWHSWASWDIREEKFGQPMVVAKTLMNDEKVMKKVFDWLMSLTTDNVAVMPSIAGEFQIIEPSSTDVYEMFKEKIVLANQEISKGVEGATSTMDQGKKFQVSDVHERTSEKITADDMIYLYQRIKNALVPFLIKHGYPFSGQEDFEFVSVETLSKETTLENVHKFTQLGYRFNSEQVQELIGIEITSEPVADLQNPAAIANKVMQKPVPKKTIPLYPQKPVNTNQARIEKLYADACQKCTKSSPSNEGEKNIDLEEFERIWNGLAERIYDGDRIIVDEELWLETSDWLSRALAEGFELVDNTPSEAMVAALNENVAIFSAFKTYQQLRFATDLLLDEDGTLKSFSTFKADVLAMNQNYNLYYLQAEYVNAVTSAQSAAKWEQFELDAEDFDLQYETAGDERVRREHERLDGIVRPVNDSVWDEIMPPNGWRCRCTVTQVDDLPLTDPDLATREAGRAHRNEIFKFNPGKTRQAFPERHPYYTGVNQDDLRDLQDFIDENV